MSRFQARSIGLPAAVYAIEHDPGGAVEQETGALPCRRELGLRPKPLERSALVAEIAPGSGEPRGGQGTEASPHGVEAPRDVDPIRDDELGGGRRRRRPDIGREVRERDVDLVADATHNGHRMGDDRANDASRR